MIAEPNIDKLHLKQVLENEFGFSVESIEFDPRGEASLSYLIHSGGKIFFLKVYDTSSIDERIFRFISELYEICGIKNVVHPIKTKADKLSIIFGRNVLVLFEYVSGKTWAEKQLSEEQFKKLGKIIAQIHLSKNKIGAYPVKEDFRNPFTNNFKNIYSAMKKLDNPNIYQRELINIYKKYKDKFISELEELEATGNKLKKSNIEFVNCHGEPSPGNVMVSESGEIYLIDWDSPLFAPKEKDLLFFDKFNSVFEGYGEISKDAEINTDARKYYTHLWNVGEIVDWAERVLFKGSSDEENKHNLDKLEEFLDYSEIF